MRLDHPVDPTAIRTQLGAILVLLEVSQANWLITSLSPRSGEKMSEPSLEAQDMPSLLGLFADLRRKAAIRTGKTCPIVAIQESKGCKHRTGLPVRSSQ